jgi:hypothetical protein
MGRLARLEQTAEAQERRREQNPGKKDSAHVSMVSNPGAKSSLTSY